MPTTNAVVQQKPKFSVAISTDIFQKLINNTLGDPERSRRFTASITSAVATTPALQECDAGTIIAGALLGDSLNLSPSPQLGQYYLVPFKKKSKAPDGSYTETTVAQFVIGYRGLLQLAMRSGKYVGINAIEVREGEYRGKNRFSGDPEFVFVEDDEERERRPVIGYMACYEQLNGFKKAVYWSKEKVIAHAVKYAHFDTDAYQKLINNQIPSNEMWKYSSNWYSNFDGMAQKTLLKQLISKWGIMSIDTQQINDAIEKDGSEIEVKGKEFVALPEVQDAAPATATPGDAPAKTINLSDV